MNDFETMAFVDRAEQMAERVQAMTLEELVQIWNAHEPDLQDRFSLIVPMNDFKHWETLMDDLDAAKFIGNLFYSQRMKYFSPSDAYFYFDSTCDNFISFADAEDLLNHIGITYFVERLLDAEE